MARDIVWGGGSGEKAAYCDAERFQTIGHLYIRFVGEKTNGRPEQKVTFSVAVN